MKQCELGREISMIYQWNRIDFSETDYKYDNLIYDKEDNSNHQRHILFTKRFRDIWLTIRIINYIFYITIFTIDSKYT